MVSAWDPINTRITTVYIESSSPKEILSLVLNESISDMWGEMIIGKGEVIMPPIFSSSFHLIKENVIFLFILFPHQRNHLRKEKLSFYISLIINLGTENYISMWKIQVIILNFPDSSNLFTKNLPQKLNKINDLFSRNVFRRTFNWGKPLYNCALLQWTVLILVNRCYLTGQILGTEITNTFRN